MKIQVTILKYKNISGALPLLYQAHTTLPWNGKPLSSYGATPQEAEDALAIEVKKALGVFESAKSLEMDFQEEGSLG
jgi:hypothetical protein